MTRGGGTNMKMVCLSHGTRHKGAGSFETPLLEPRELSAAGPASQCRSRVRRHRESPSPSGEWFLQADQEGIWGRAPVVLRAQPLGMRRAWEGPGGGLPPGAFRLLITFSHMSRLVCNRSANCRCLVFRRLQLP